MAVNFRSLFLTAHGRQFSVLELDLDEDDLARRLVHHVVLDARLSKVGLPRLHRIFRPAAGAYGRQLTVGHRDDDVVVVAATIASTSGALAQSRGEDEREQTYLDALRREDTSAAERYIALRDARAQALTDMRKVEAQYNAAGAQLRGLFVNALRQARK